MFQTAFQFVQQACFCIEEKRYKLNGKNHKILVHCFAGMNRSPTIVTAILMYFEKLSLKEAFECVAKKRPCVDILEDNRNQLIHFEEELRQSRSSMDVIDFTYVIEAAKSSSSLRNSYESISRNSKPKISKSPAAVAAENQNLPPERSKSQMTILKNCIVL
jgi:tRNA threonylcarbamoyladenosine modification (KEOPS) complex  Pcc1 subunit